MTPPDTQRYLLDTNILVYYVRGKELGEYVEATYSLKTVAMAPIICAVTEGELRSLALKFSWGRDKRRKAEALLERFVVVQLDLPGLYDAYASIDDHSRQQGMPMGENDLWIAATAHVTGARLLTTDKDFDHLDPGYLTRDYIDQDAYK